MSCFPAPSSTRNCDVCERPFAPRTTMHSVCSIRCSIKRPKVLEKRERAAEKVRRDNLKTLSDWNKEAQDAFNKYVRLRDIKAGHGCIDCGKPFEPNKPGGSVDAGHFRSRGSAKHLRFDERNCFAQRKNCNMPGGTTHAAFRAGVIERIGLEAVEALEADHAPRQYRADDLKAIRDDYRKRVREMAQ